MSNEDNRSSRGPNRWRGAGIGALIGGTGRPAVILIFWAITPDLHSANSMDDLGFRFGLILALAIASFNGVWIGALAGAMGRPAVGSAVGFALSASTCSFYCGFRLTEFAVWIILMGVVGAAAGACGSAAGKGAGASVL